MALRLDDAWLWDFWFARDGDAIHVFFLKAPRALGDPERRHTNARIGHAVSSDLRSWTVLPDALAPGTPDAFDGQATWTGSVLRVDGSWVMAYTGIGTEHGVRVQRVGFARSSDLVRWDRWGPVVEADGRWYERLGPGSPESTWRDPWLFEHDGRFHMLVTARATTGPEDGRGVIAHAVSDDMADWEVRPPITDPGDFRTLEVPQLERIGGRWRLLFSVQPAEHSAARLARPGVVREGGSHVLSADERLGPFAIDGDQFLLGDDPTRHYAARFVQHDDRWWLMAWTERTSAGGFAGELADPLPLATGPDGRLVIDGRNGHG